MEKRKEGVFHRHPAKKEGHGRSNITAGVRKRQRFRVVSREVRVSGGEGRGDRGGGWRGKRNLGLVSVTLSS